MKMESPLPRQNTSFYPFFNTRAGSQGFSYYYNFSRESALIEQARVELNLGSDIYKFLLGGDNYQSKMYPDLPVLRDSQKDTIVHLIENESVYQMVFNLPFKFYVMWTSAMGIPYWHFGDGLSTEYAVKEYGQIYDLTRYLLLTYQNSGKVFLIGHWEGDWVLLEGFDYEGTPRDSMIQGMSDWYRNRQTAVEDARNSLPNIQGVEVYHYAEVNIVQKALQKKKTVLTSVLSQVTVDAVSYSSYDAVNHRDEMPDRLYTHLDFILNNAHFSGKWHYGKPVFIGEYCAPGYDSPERGDWDLASLKAASHWGCPLILYWSVYSVNTDTPAALINPDDTKSKEYDQLHTFIGKSLILKNATRVWLNRNPNDNEMNQLADAFDTIPTSEILFKIINSDEYNSSAEDCFYLEMLFRNILKTDDFKGELFVSLLEKLEKKAITRFAVILFLLDSNEFAHAVSDEDFYQYINRNMYEQENFDKQSDIDKMPKLKQSNIEHRSVVYEAALNSNEFMEMEFNLKSHVTVTNIIYFKYMLNFSDIQ